MTNNIVTLNVTQTVAEALSTLQGTGAAISQGGTNTPSGTLSTLTQLSDFTPIMAGSKAITSMILSGGTVTVTTTAPHGWPLSETFAATVAGVTPSAYNGTFQITITGTSTFTYPLAGSPGSVTVQGAVTDADVTELLSMVTTFFAQGTAVSLLVLELGAGDVPTGVTALTAYITANPLTVYRWLVPREWDAVSQFLAFLANYNSTTARVYFHVTTTIGTYSSYTNLMKCVMAWVEAPGIPSTEFSAAADFYVTLSYSPSTTTKVPPNAFAYLFGVTPYPVKGNSALFSSLKAASVNWVGTGAEGGISTAIVLWGTMKDGNDVLYWYSVDWVQIQEQLDLANEIINGSNNPQAPLYYDQNGINRLQARAQSTMNSGVASGLVLGPVSVTAVSFADYIKANPADYPVGKYNGLAVTYTPNRGFKSITFNVQVSNIPTP